MDRTDSERRGEQREEGRQKKSTKKGSAVMLGYIRGGSAGHEDKLITRFHRAEECERLADRQTEAEIKWEG